MASAFREALAFFYDLGIYDVVLPFLLVFTIVFAILEKTRIFGSYKSGDKEYTKKNLNAMFAFVAALFVVGSAQLVAVINQAVAHVVMLLLLSILFLLLAGSFHGDKEFSLEDSPWQKAFMWIMFLGVVLIFLNSLGWLQFVYGYVTAYWNTTTVSSIILLLFIVGIIMLITREPKSVRNKEES